MNTIERLKELEAKATKSWRVCDEQSWKIYDDPQSIVADISAKNDWSHGMTMNCIHASLIAEMRNALPKLLAVVEAANAFYWYRIAEHAIELGKALEGLEK